MSLVIEDLDESVELDADARKAVMGGSSVARGIYSRSVGSALATGGLRFASSLSLGNLVMPGTVSAFGSMLEGSTYRQ